MKVNIIYNVYLKLYQLEEKKLSLIQLVLINIICQMPYGCKLSNSYLSYLLNVNEKTIRRNLKELESKNLIVINYKDMNKKEKQGRTIFLSSDGLKIASHKPKEYEIINDHN